MIQTRRILPDISGKRPSMNESNQGSFLKVARYRASHGSSYEKKLFCSVRMSEDLFKAIGSPRRANLYKKDGYFFIKDSTSRFDPMISEQKNPTTREGTGNYQVNIWEPFFTDSHDDSTFGVEHLNFTIVDNQIMAEMPTMRLPVNKAKSRISKKPRQPDLVKMAQEASEAAKKISDVAPKLSSISPTVTIKLGDAVSFLNKKLKEDDTLRAEVTPEGLICITKRIM